MTTIKEEIAIIKTKLNYLERWTYAVIVGLLANLGVTVAT